MLKWKDFFVVVDGGLLVGWFCVHPISRTEQKQPLSKLGVFYSFLEDSYFCRQEQCSMHLICTKAKGIKCALTWLVWNQKQNENFIVDT